MALGRHRDNVWAGVRMHGRSREVELYVAREAHRRSIQAVSSIDTRPEFRGPSVAQAQADWDAGRDIISEFIVGRVFEGTDSEMAMTVVSEI